MGIAPYLAMTAGEMEKFGGQFPQKALLAGFFSPYGSGLTELPQTVPDGCPLVLSDRVPIQGHDPKRICGQLEGLNLPALILDLQRKDEPEAAGLAAFLAEALPFPVIVSAPYAREASCPVLVPPVPCHVSLSRHLESWEGREIWLELGLTRETITVTAQGATVKEAEYDHPLVHPDTSLCCHYGFEVRQDQAVFHLMRTREDLTALNEKAQAMGVTTIGLFQEVGSHWT